MNRIFTTLMGVLIIVPGLSRAEAPVITPVQELVQDLTAQAKAAIFEGKLNGALELTKSAFTSLDPATVAQLVKANPSKAALITAAASFVGYKGYKTVQAIHNKWQSLRPGEKVAVGVMIVELAYIATVIGALAGNPTAISALNSFEHKISTVGSAVYNCAGQVKDGAVALFKSGKAGFEGFRESLTKRLDISLPELRSGATTAS